MNVTIYRVVNEPDINQDKKEEEEKEPKQRTQVTRRRRSRLQG